ncbi:hypothetical protein [Chryseobacterium sp.]|nr:hypothetical protein [Chryseobacterium sp.]
MNRQELLKNGLLAGTFSMIPFSGLMGENKMLSEKTEEDLSGLKK